MNTTFQHSADQKVYRPPLLWRLRPFLVCLVAVAFLWVMFLWITTQSSGTTNGRTDLFNLLLLFSPCLVVLGALWCLTTLNTRIVTAPVGITYYNSGLCLYSPWKNIVGHEKRPLGARSIDSLRLRQAALEGMSLQEGLEQQIAVLAKAPALRTLETTLPFLRVLVILLSILTIFSGSHSRHARLSSSKSSESQHIPVGFFGAQWKYGELRQDVQRYAPQALV